MYKEFIVAFIENVSEKIKMNNEAFAMMKVLMGRIKLHRYEQHKERNVMLS